jgi:hypothetical protein
MLYPTDPRSSRRLRYAAAVCALAAAASGPVAGAESQIGATSVVVNSVTGTLATTHESAPLRAGIDVFQNETIDTADNSASRVVFQDRTELSVGPQSSVVLDRFVFDPDPSKSAVAVSIAKGVARFSTGLLPKPDYAINTPAAQIGVRGTVLTVTVSAARATTVSVDSGSAFVTGRGVTVTVDAGYSTLVRFGMAPTPPVPSPPPPVITVVMDTLLSRASGSALGTQVGARASGVEMPQLGAGQMLSPNIDPKTQAEIAGDATPPFGGNGSGSRGTHGSEGSRGTHGGGS